jgi:hypothetical protein
LGELNCHSKLTFILQYPIDGKSYDNFRVVVGMKSGVCALCVKIGYIRQFGSSLVCQWANLERRSQW